jgi:hypothetical protein
MQAVCPDEQVFMQFPFIQDWPDGQALLQYPQWAVLVLTSTQVSLHSNRSAGQMTAFVVIVEIGITVMRDVGTALVDITGTDVTGSGSSFSTITYDPVCVSPERFPVPATGDVAACLPPIPEPVIME